MSPPSVPIRRWPRVAEVEAATVVAGMAVVDMAAGTVAAVAAEPAAAVAWAAARAACTTPATRVAA